MDFRGGGCLLALQSLQTNLNNKIKKTPKNGLDNETYIFDLARIKPKTIKLSGG